VGLRVIENDAKVLDAVRIVEVQVKLGHRERPLVPLLRAQDAEGQVHPRPRVERLAEDFGGAVASGKQECRARCAGRGRKEYTDEGG
jgi:hypothetical protein